MDVCIQVEQDTDLQCLPLETGSLSDQELSDKDRLLASEPPQHWFYKHMLPYPASYMDARTQTQTVMLIHQACH